MFLAEAASELTRKVDEAFLWIGGICLFFLVGITTVMVVFVIKYGRKRHPKAEQIEANPKLEIAWIVIPTLIVLFMFFKGYEGFKYMRSVPDGAMVVDVIARSWNWTFVYPQENVSSDRLFVPVDTPIKLNLTSAEGDVIHSFYLPDFRIKEDCVPGRMGYMWFEPERIGTYPIYCAEYCGTDHSKMITRMEVISDADFDAWLEQKVADQNKPVVMEKAMDPNSQEIQERDAAKLYTTYCASCHGENGEGGLVGGARDFRDLEGWKRGPKITDIYRTLSEGIEGTQMRAFTNIPPWDRFALAHHVASFYRGSDRPQATQEEIDQLKEDYSLGERTEPRKQISVEKAMEIIAAETSGQRSGEE